MKRGAFALVTETDRMEPVFYRLTAVDSTNAFLFREGMNGAPDGSVCVSDEQTAGKGRMDRVWNSPAGKGLWLSVLLRPDLNAEDTPLLTYCAALAMSDALREEACVENKIKWPNDIVAGGKKICGILCTSSLENGKPAFAVIGTGVNLLKGSYPAELSDRATSVEDVGGKTDRESLMQTYLRYLKVHVDTLVKGNKESILKKVTERCITVGSEVEVTGSVQTRGIAEDIGPEGELIIREPNGVKKAIFCGDVSVRGVMGYV